MDFTQQLNDSTLPAEASAQAGTQHELSVLMVVFNQEQYIAAAIESVLASTYTDFEFIIVDDCSTDNTVSIIHSFEKDNRIRLVVNEKNLGQFSNRNKAAQLANGRYIKYFDSDDIMYPNCLELMLEGMKAFPGAGLGMEYRYAKSNSFPVVFSSYEAYHMYFVENKWMVVGPPGSIYKKDVFEKVGGFSGTPYVSDFELNLKLAAITPCIGLQPDLFFYRVHEGQGMAEGNMNTGYKIYTHKVQKDSLLDNNCPLSKKDVASALRMINKLQARRALMDLFRFWEIKRFKQIVVASGLGWNGFFKGLITFG